MITKQVPNKKNSGGKSGRVAALSDYITAPENTKAQEKCVHAFSGGFMTSTYAAQKNEMVALAEESRSKDPIEHVVFSFKAGEVPTSEQAEQAVQIMLKHLGMEHHQYFAGLHDDTGNMHIHVEINRVNNLTGKAKHIGFMHDALMQCNALIEYEQGWTPEPNALYQVIDGELCNVREPRKDRVKVQAKIRDREVQTGEKSALRVAQEQAAPLLKNSDSWQAVHESLAEIGMRYTKKGSGAVIFVGEDAVKASDVSSVLTLSKMQKRLGDYQPASPDVKLSPAPSPQPVNDTAKSLGFGDYAQARRVHKIDRAALKSALEQRIKDERDELYNSQSLERRQALKGNWKGKGDVLSVMRSVLAADHAKAKAELTDQHKALRQTLIKERPSLFPDFETWVSKKHGKEAAERYRYAEQVAEIIGQDTKHKQQREHDIRSYVPEAIGQEVHYRNSMGMTDFVDHGPKISFLTRSNESVLAGLQLAQQRFGKSLTLAGGDDFKQQAIEIAVRSGITIANQELQDAIKEERERQALERKIAMQSETQQQFWRYHEAVGADSYRVSSRSESTGKTWAMGRQQDGSIPGYAPDSLPWQSIEQLKQKQSEHLYLTPLSRTHHLILVDDTTPDKIEQMERDGIQLAYLQQSSTASFQAIIKIPRLEPVDRPDLASKEKSPEYLASVQLAQTLNQKYGDPHLSNAVQPHRMPATPNVKKKHRASDGMFPTVTLISAPGHTWDLGTSHIKAIIERQVQLEQNTKTVHSLTRQPDTTAPRPPADHSLYDDFKRDIEKKILKGPAQDLSTLDYMVALRLRAVGKSQHEVASIIESCTDQAGRRHQWQDYAGRTADRAFGFTGTRDLERMSKYHPSWQKIADKAQAQQAQDRVPSHRGRGAGMQM